MCPSKSAGKIICLGFSCNFIPLIAVNLTLGSGPELIVEQNFFSSFLFLGAPAPSPDWKHKQTFFPSPIQSYKLHPFASTRIIGRLSPTLAWKHNPSSAQAPIKGSCSSSALLWSAARSPSPSRQPGIHYSQLGKQNNSIHVAMKYTQKRSTIFHFVVPKHCSCF